MALATACEFLTTMMADGLCVWYSSRAGCLELATSCGGRITKCLIVGKSREHVDACEVMQMNAGFGGEGGGARPKHAGCIVYML